MTKNTFSFSNRTDGFQYSDIGIGLVMLITLWVSFEKMMNDMSTPTFLVPIIMLFIFILYKVICALLCIHRMFIVKIRFDEDKIVYKSLFRKIILTKKDVQNICIASTSIKGRRGLAWGAFVRKLDSFNESYSNYTALDSAYFVQIGIVTKYPSNAIFLLTKPVSKKYITLQYQDGLDVWLRKYDPKQIYKGLA